MANRSPRRGRFRIHLSTALILALAAGILIYVNAIPRTGKPWASFKYGGEFYPGARDYGWPADALTQDSPTPFLVPVWSGIALDAAVALAILSAVAVVCEAWVRFWNPPDDAPPV